MKTEEHAWKSLRQHASAQLSPGFPDRVLRAARGAAASVAPSFLSQFALGAVTAALCLAAVALFHAKTASGDDEQNIASWQQVASDADDVAQAL